MGSHSFLLPIDSAGSSETFSVGLLLNLLPLIQPQGLLFRSPHLRVGDGVFVVAKINKKPETLSNAPIFSHFFSST
jgi:hypothetical protein